MSSRSRAGLVFAALSLFLCAAAATSLVAKEKAEATCKSVSPYDGSLWIATDGDGIFRLGRNGRTVRYTEAGGQLGSDSVVWLDFDNQKLLWILDGSGLFRTYSPVHGFQVQGKLPDGILTAATDANAGLIYFATSSSLFSLDPATGEYGKVVDLSLVPRSLHVSSKSDEIWVLGEESVLKCTPDGSLTQWEEGFDVSNMLHFVFETNEAPAVVERRFNIPVWLVILLALVAFIAGWVLSAYILSRARTERNEGKAEHVLEDAGKSQKEVETIHVENDVETSDYINTDVPAALSTSSKTSSTAPAPVQVNASGQFTKSVMELIDENISDPNFDVDKLADLTGLSRIHVNRKLKAEGTDSPSALIKSARMTLAAKLLANGLLTISQVSAECGFRTPSYFATAFKDFYGVSPTDYLSSGNAQIHG